VLKKETLVASADTKVAVPATPVAAPVKADVAKAYKEMSKSERKEFKKALKTELKNYIKGKKPGDTGASVADAKVMDHDLKMALIFGSVAIVLSFFGGVNSVFWILSVVALVVAVVFFIKWLAEQ
jgi:cell division protein FtsW (lipid II flippase)